MFLTQTIKRLKERPSLKFYCLKCNIFFKVEEGILLDNVKCPECGTSEVFIELEFEDDARPSYIS